MARPWLPATAQERVLDLLTVMAYPPSLTLQLQQAVVLLPEEPPERP
jgi:hypothetical protein